MNTIKFENNYRYSSDFENHKDGSSYLAGKINLQTTTYSERDYTPTPLDPDNVFVGHVPYAGAINTLLNNRLESVAPEEMPQEVIEFLQGVMARDNNHRSTRNARAMNRLRQIYDDFPAMSDQYGDLITDLRAGTASIEDALRLISIIPELGSIEIMKFTSPFDGKGIVEANHITYSHLKKICRELGFVVEEVDKSEHPLRLKNVVAMEGAVGVIIRKQPELRIFANGVELELMGSQTEAVFKPGTFGLPQNVINGANVQPINISKYLRLAQTD